VARCPVRLPLYHLNPKSNHPQWCACTVTAVQCTVLYCTVL